MDDPASTHTAETPGPGGGTGGASRWRSTPGRESPRARQAWADYVALGPGRSLDVLAKRYQTERADGRRVPTVRLATLADWSRHFHWQARLQVLADQAAAEAAEREATYRREILESGFALAHERVKALNELAGVLLDDLREASRRWLRDVKGIGSGDNWQTVEIERFNASELEQFRGLLDDIAKEKGDRKQKLEHTGTVAVSFADLVKRAADYAEPDPE